MSVAQVLEQVQGFSSAELEELIAALEQEQLKKYNVGAAQRWSGKKFEMRTPPDLSEPPLPFKRLIEEIG